MPQATSLPEHARNMWHIQRVKRMIRDQLGAGAQCMISVQEIICTDPECPGPATQLRIVMINFHEISGLIHKTPAQVSAADVAAVLNRE